MINALNKRDVEPGEAKILLCTILTKVIEGKLAYMPGKWHNSHYHCIGGWYEYFRMMPGEVYVPEKSSFLMKGKASSHCFNFALALSKIKGEFSPNYYIPLWVARETGFPEKIVSRLFNGTNTLINLGQIHEELVRS